MPRETQLAAFGRAVQQAREAKGWTKAQLAREIGTVPSFVQQIEAGETGLTDKRLAVLEEVLDRVGQLGWIIGHGPPPELPTVEATIEADASLTDNEKRILLATLREIRKISAEQRDEVER